MVTNAFVAQRIESFSSAASPGLRLAFATASAQRARALADAVVDGLRLADGVVLDEVLQACWSCVAADDLSGLPAHRIPDLLAAMVDDDDPASGLYHWAVNDALAAVVYAVQSAEHRDGIMSTVHTAQRFLDLADLVLHQGHSGYRSDAKYEAAMTHATKWILDDVAGVTYLCDDAGVLAYRQLCDVQGRQVVALGVNSG